MPVWVNGSHAPTGSHGSEVAARASANLGGCTISIALINNMPDAALKDTELQFLELLDAAAGDIPMRVARYSLPGIVRGTQGRQRLNDFYQSIGDLWNSGADVLIMTGTEPHQPDLRREPYWRILTQVLDWAAENTHFALLSCLAVHASVLHSDGITRHALPDKRFGVFESEPASNHALIHDTPAHIRFPHSRWNEVRECDLVPSGYVVLTRSAVAGVDSFVKRNGKSLFWHFQGHPEYGALTLLKEYRRDVRRFLNHERETYPAFPSGYFDHAAESLLMEFRVKALADPRVERMDSFPTAEISAGLTRAWRPAAILFYRNWMNYVVSRKSQPTRPVAVSSKLSRLSALSS
ncbi:MAG: homoserine O-succinyltransferase MetA [Terriglobia bacterium]